MKVVRIFGSEMEAELARVHLEAAGIKATITKDDVGGMNPFLQLTQGVRLSVEDKQFEEASKIIEAGGISYHPLRETRSSKALDRVVWRALLIAVPAGLACALFQLRGGRPWYDEVPQTLLIGVVFAIPAAILLIPMLALLRSRGAGPRNKNKV